MTEEDFEELEQDLKLFEALKRHNDAAAEKERQRYVVPNRRDRRAAKKKKAGR